MFKVMQDAGLPYDTLLGREMMISYQCHMRVLELSEKELGIQSIGLVLATRQLVTHLSPIFDILLGQNSVRDSIIAAFGNLETVIEGLKARLRVDQDFAYAELLTDYPFLNESSIFHDHGAGLLAQYLRWIVGREFKMTSVSIPHSEPRDLSRFRSFFGCPVSFGDSHIAICFEREVLDKPISGNAENLVREYNEVLEWDRNASLLAQVRRIIRNNIMTDVSQVDSVADALKLSKRTLQRRLAEKGTGFQKQLDSVRAGLARRFIYQKELSIADIAIRLGYTEQECFTRAFLRWYAKTPSEWRASIEELDSLGTNLQ